MGANYRSNLSRSSALALALVAGTLSCTAAYAQADDAATAAPSATGLKEIVVTAQKRRQNLQDVGVSVTALDSQQLRMNGIVDSKDIAKSVPGVLLDSTSGGSVNANLTVRGISQSDFSSSQESPNSIYIDEVYMSSPNSAAFPLYDLDRVEVLRGPQGTLFGRASSGGLANFITARPSKTWQGYGEIGYGSYNSAYVEAAVGGPLSDRVRFRLAGRTETGNGWFQNELPTGKDTFQTDFYGIRAQVEADLTETLTARLSFSYDRDPKHLEGTYHPVPFYLVDGTPTPLPANVDAYGTGPGNDFAGYRSPYSDVRKGQFNNVGYLKNERISPTLNLNWKIGGATVTSITNFTKFKFDYREDCDGGPVDYCEFPQGQNLKQWSQELRINGKTGKLDYTAGAYYLNIKQTTPTSFAFPALSGTEFAFSDENLVHQQLESYSAFGQLEYAFTPKLKLLAGARFTHDHKTVDSKTFFYELGSYYGGAGVYSPPLVAYDFSEATVGDAAKRSDSMWSGKVELDYKPTNRVMVYASVSRGVKGSGFNTNVSGNLTYAQTPFKSEYLYAYEVGAKTELFDRHLRVNASAFYYDYHRFQGFAFNGLQGQVGNYDGYFTGGELEVVATPMRGLTVNLGAAYLKSKLYDVPTAYFGVRDEQSILAPKWSANGSITKSFDLSAGELDLTWSADYQGDRYASIDNNPATFVRGSFEHNARISFSPEGSGVDIAFFVNNISNAKRQNFVYDLITSTGSVIRSYGKPRWFGGSIRKTF